jgi:hypothetical protein
MQHKLTQAAQRQLNATQAGEGNPVSSQGKYFLARENISSWRMKLQGDTCDFRGGT